MTVNKPRIPPIMESTKLVKTTVQLPMGSEAGKFTIQVPTSAFDNDAEIAKFTSKIATAVLKISREVTQAKEPLKQAAIPETEPAIQPVSKASSASGNVDVINFQLRYLGTLVYFRARPYTRMQKSLEAFATRQGLPVEDLQMYTDKLGEIDGDETPEDLGLEDGDVVEVEMVEVEL